MEAHPGARSTVSPGPGERGRGLDDALHGGMVRRQSRPASTSMTGTSGACRESASRDHVAVAAEQHRRRAAGRGVAAHQVVEAGALGEAAGDPDHRVVGLQRRPRRRAGWWPWSRRPRSTPSTLGDRRRSGGRRAGSRAARRAPRPGGTPWARASAAAASALATMCGRRARRGRRPCTSSAALVCRSAMNARSTRMSSTTPTIPTPGMPRVKPIARAPSTTSASRTSRSVSGSATL